MFTPTKLAISAVGASLLALGSVATFTESAAALNDRPVEPLGSSVDGVPLQKLLNDITVDGPGIDVIEDQTRYDLFTNGALGGAESTFLFEVAGFAPLNVFGIYKAGNPTFQVPLFFGQNDEGDAVSVRFLDDNSIRVTTEGLPPGNEPAPVFQTAADFGNIFGFYIETGGGETFFSEDRLNPGGVPQALIYQGDGETELKAPGRKSGIFLRDEFIVAFEDQLFGTARSDEDFQDLVVIVESVVPVDVPEPTTLAGLGLLAGAMAVSRRRKNSRNS